jgi:glycosyltransferase involved in cell wall biosynthesis
MLARRHEAALTIRVAANYDHIYQTSGRLAYPRLLRSRMIEQRLARAILKRAALVFPANRNNEAFAIANGVPPERCVVVPAYGNVINSAHLAEPASRSSDVVPNVLRERSFLVMVSRLEPVKHPEDALEVLALVRREGLDVDLLVIGDGSMRSHLESLAERLGISDHIHLVGSQPQRWIAANLTRASAILSPLTGRALVEALLSARPVIAYDIEWQSEMIQDGITGILVPYRDVDAMAIATIDVIRDPQKGDRLGAEGRSMSLGLINRERVMDIQRRAYEQILPKKEGR